jgi:hypothetical protein
MSYTILFPHLHPIADAVRRYFGDQWGVRSFSIEKKDIEVDYKFTLSAVTKNYHQLRILVEDKAYLSSLDRVVLKCKNDSLPVLLYVAIRKGLDGPEYNTDCDHAHEVGVGILEVNERGKVVEKHRALSLSLTGVSFHRIAGYPDKYKQELARAQESYKNGEPAKACSIVYDQIELLSKRVAEMLRKRAWTDKSVTIPRDWGPTLDLLINRISESKTVCRNLERTFLNKILGMTTDRHDMSHPRTGAKLRDRDRELRNRFESAEGTLLKLIEVTKPLRGIHR